MASEKGAQNSILTTRHHNTTQVLAWENSRHLATPLLVSPPNDFWETSAEIPYWWRITTQIWVVLLIGWIKFSHAARPILSTTQLWVVTRLRYGISALVSQTSFGGEASGGFAKCWLFFFFSLSNLKNNFDTQLEYVDLRDSVKQARNTWQKSKFGIEQHHLCFRFRQWSNWIPANT